MTAPALHNVTIYVERSRFAATRAFYEALLGAPLWEEDAHIACFGSVDVALCVHEEEPGHPAGAREFFFWVEDLGQTDELRSVDPEGNQVRMHTRRGAPR